MSIGRRFVLMFSLFGLAALGGLGCPARSVEPTGADASASSGADAGVATPDANGQASEPQDSGTPPLDAGLDGGPAAALPGWTFELEFAPTDGGSPQLAQFDHDVAQVDPLIALTIHSPVALGDYRIRLIDWADQVVPSDDVELPTDGGFLYRVQLTQPTRPGRTYTFSVEAELGAQLTDGSGRPLDDVRKTLIVRGDPQPEPNAKKSGAKRKR